jgi:transposase
MKRRYLKYVKILNKKFELILRCFALDSTATYTAKFIGLNRKTVNRIYQLLRLSIFKTVTNLDWLESKGEFELDESYFGATRVRGKRGRGANGKTIVFGLLKRNGLVYTQIITKADRNELLPIIQGKILEGSTVYTDGWRSYNSLVTLGYKHHRIYHSKDEFARGKNHVNGIESFWAYSKHRLSKFKGFKKTLFYLHLKESEWRFNNRHTPIDEQIKVLKTLLIQYQRFEK